MGQLNFRIVAAVTWLLALTNYVINHPWTLFSDTLAMALNRAAGVVGTITFLLWLLVVGWAFRTYGRKAWWLMLSAPFAMMTFLSVALFVVVSLIVPH